MKGYHINDVYKAMCECWNVPPIKPSTKEPYYSDKPALLADGEMDNACRPLYIDMIHHYMPNSQRLLFTLRSHMVGGGLLEPFINEFLEHPYIPIKISSVCKKTAHFFFCLMISQSQFPDFIILEETCRKISPSYYK